MLVTPHISAAWQHAFDDVTPGASVAFASTGIGFDVASVTLAEDSALIDVGIDLVQGTNITTGVSHSGPIAHDLHDDAVIGSPTWVF